MTRKTKAEIAAEFDSLKRIVSAYVDLDQKLEDHENSPCKLCQTGNWCSERESLWREFSQAHSTLVESAK